jgi:enoyl-CoA hydratase/carnithine racemase
VSRALDREVSAELNAAVKEISVDRGCRIVILRGAGDTFCAGDDVKASNNWEPTDFIWQVRMYQETVAMIDNLVPVTIAAVDGVCTGAGLELTLVCDFVVATNRSRWGMPEINGKSLRVGVAPRRSPSSPGGEKPRSGTSSAV